jgi:hypothetical protein
VAKYLEQLFLDCYKFYLNKYENSGANSTQYLYARWSEERFDMGTEIYRHANLLAKKSPEKYE